MQRIGLHPDTIAEPGWARRRNKLPTNTPTPGAEADVTKKCPAVHHLDEKPFRFYNDQPGIGQPLRFNPNGHQKPKPKPNVTPNPRACDPEDIPKKNNYWFQF